MAESGRTPKPGHDHLIPEAAWRLYPERHIANSDWKNLDTYAGHEDWSGDRWAWEFLRRNRFFQRDCDELNVALGKKQRPRPKLDSKWMLELTRFGGHRIVKPRRSPDESQPQPQTALFTAVSPADG